MASVTTTEEHAAKAILALVMTDATDELKKSVREWLPIRDETITTLKEIIEILHKTSKDVAISNVVGSSVSAAGGAVAIGLLIAAPFTVGATLVPSAVVGGVTGSLGGATAIGSSITGLVIDGKQVDKAKKCIEEDRRHLELLQKELECYRKMYHLAISKIEQTVRPESGSYMALDLDTAGPRLGCNGARAVATGIAAGGAVAATTTAGRVAGTGASVGVRIVTKTTGRVAGTGAGVGVRTVTMTAGKVAGTGAGVGVRTVTKTVSRGAGTGAGVGVRTATRTASRVAGTGASVGVRTTALVVAHAVALVGFGLDIAMIAVNGVKLGQGAKSDIGTKLEEAVRALKEERDQIEKVYLEDSSDESNDD